MSVHSLPNEILTRIFLEVGPADMASCMASCQRFEAVFRETVLLSGLHATHWRIKFNEDFTGLPDAVVNLVREERDVEAALILTHMAELKTSQIRVPGEAGSCLTLLAFAAANGCRRSVDVLLCRPDIEPNAGSRGLNALCTALNSKRPSGQQEGIVRSILGHPSTNPNMSCGKGEIALARAAAAGEGSYYFQHYS